MLTSSVADLIWCWHHLVLTSFGADILGIWSNRILESSQWPSLVPDWDIHPCFQFKLHWWNKTDLIFYRIPIFLCVKSSDPREKLWHRSDIRSCNGLVDWLYVRGQSPQISFLFGLPICFVSSFLVNWNFQTKSFAFLLSLGIQPYFVLITMWCLILYYCVGSFMFGLNYFYWFFLMMINCNASLCLCENTKRRWCNFHQEEGQEVQLLFWVFFCISSWKCSSIWHNVSYLLVGSHLPGL